MSKHKHAYQEETLKLKLGAAFEALSRYERLRNQDKKCAEVEPRPAFRGYHERRYINHNRLYLHWLDQVARLSAKLTRYYKYKLGPIP